jgi:murein L,D-transpeptidase YcbB/YkuD
MASLALAPWARLAHATEPPPWRMAGRPTALAQRAVQWLLSAGDHGLVPADYLAEALAGAGPAMPDPVYELSLTLAFELYLRDLHQGRIDPGLVKQRFHPAAEPAFDPAEALRTARLAGDIDAVVHAATPALRQYAQLQQALAFHRALADHPGWQLPLPPLPPLGRRARLETGQAWVGLPQLAARLAALGDLQAEPSGPPTLYDRALADAVRAFQLRHGLATDGVVGPVTLAALEVTPAARVQQIGLALERLRWTPLMLGPRMIVVNIPEFVLRAYEVQDGRIQLRTQMRVIVGRALDTRTPLFSELMRAIEFSPYWNVPPSIARQEIVPRLRRDPAYLGRQGFEFVDARGHADTVLTPSKLDAVLAGRLRIRQRPGPLNALGDIKFVFPNSDNIFLHHTASTGLFDRDRRDLSHGCIRVQDPLGLAKFVLANEPAWDEARIREAMSRGQSNTLMLRDPLPVVIAYGTSLVKSGRTWFFDDIYGHDRLLDAALRARSAQLKANRR